MNRISKRFSATFIAGVVALTLTACSENTVDSEEHENKPAKSDVTSGCISVTEAQRGPGSNMDAIRDFCYCYVDEIYDSASVDTLKALADRDLDYRATKDEKQLLKKARTKCGG